MVDNTMELLPKTKLSKVYIELVVIYPLFITISLIPREFMIPGRK